METPNLPTLSYMLVTLNIMLILHYACGAYVFATTPHIALSDKERTYLNTISDDEWNEFTNMGSDSINKQERLEDNIKNSHTTVENGSISHVQLLNWLPNTEIIEDNNVAAKILKSALFVYNGRCLEQGIDGVHCQEYLAHKELPLRSELYGKCVNILQSRRDGHHPFRRLLPRHYKDGFFEMFVGGDTPEPRAISDKALNRNDVPQTDENHRNLALIVWAQFIEHDLSKPVFTSMANGYSIECCNKDNFKLQPRLHHPACVPLFRKDPRNKYGRESCLSYVRSALVVGTKCSFGAIEQVNQATGQLDLSQLYGFTTRDQTRMRAFYSGQLKSSYSIKPYEALLPTAAANKSHEFCAQKQNMNGTACFMAGDSRVNTNDFSVLLYTIFMRNHNNIANRLKLAHPDWNDDRLFRTAKEMNVEIYRRIIFDEWLPAFFGDVISSEIKTKYDHAADNETGISNEFAVAAIRFYYSMLPNTGKEMSYNYTKLELENNIEQARSSEALNTYQGTRHEPYHSVHYTAMTMLLENPTKMDAVFERGWIPENENPTHTDVLAFDIQRGRDHGLQPYVKYLEMCKNVKIKGWDNLASFIRVEDIDNLKRMYTNWTDIDLIIGGISEIPLNGSTVGPTFTCILGEQFSKLHQTQSPIRSSGYGGYVISDSMNYDTVTAFDVLCANTELRSIQSNVFQQVSKTNPLVPCAQRNKFI